MTENEQEQAITGRGSDSVEGEYQITVTHGDYTSDDVAEMLRSGEISFDFGDTTLFDGAGRRIGNIDWLWEESYFELDDSSIEVANVDGGR